MPPRSLLAKSCWLLVAMIGCGGGDTTAPIPVDHVTMTSTNTNPRVGQTASVGAQGVNAGGVAIPGVTCTFASSAPAIASVNRTTGQVAAISVGEAIITATCGDKTGSITMTVRPNTATLILNKLGNGSGGLFATPAGLTYDVGTSVTISASPISGSVFDGWGGDCAGTAIGSTCTIVMTVDRTVAGTFLLSETFSGPYSGSFGTLTDGFGCQYSVGTSGTLVATFATRTNGTVVGTSTTNATESIVTTYSPPGVTCTANPFTRTGTGAVSGTSSAMTVAAQSSGGTFRVNFTGSRSGTSITGSATVNETFRDGSGVDYPVSKTMNVTLTKQ